jgi:hypothetical protein
MRHESRVWCVSLMESPEDVAQVLTKPLWTLCSAADLGGYLFLNDAASEDGAQEYAVVKKPTRPCGAHVQVGSVAFDRLSYDQALDFIRRVLSGEYDARDTARAVDPRLETAAEHRCCRHCS